MFSSLRARLWFTYAVVIGVVLAIIGGALVVYLIRNPFTVRATLQRLRILSTLAVQRSAELEFLPTPQIQAVLERADQAYEVRAALLDAQGKAIADSRAEEAPPLPRVAWSRSEGGNARLPWFRDAGGQVWLYHVRPMSSRYALLLAAPRPKVNLWSALQDEFLPPMTRAGVVALLLALLLAFWIARWVSSPLQRISEAAQSVATGDYRFINIEGPDEVRELGRTFNEMAEQVQTSQQSQRDFVANVSHELKTPLTSIQGFAQAILDGTAGSQEELMQAAKVIHTEAGRMSQLVHDLLELARLEADSVQFRRSQVDLTDLMKEVVERYQPVAHQAEVDLDFEFEAVSTLTGDRDQLGQVFANLVDNALKFTPAGGRVVLRARQEDSWAVVSVEDNGPGIPQGEVERIFERFYQIDKARSGGGKRGSGLGLAIARQIVKAHQGEINAHSHPGQGSIFVVKLPLASAGDSQAH